MPAETPSSSPSPDHVPQPSLGAGWRRMRAAIYFALLGIAACTGWQAWQAQRLTDIRSQVAEAGRLAAENATQMQRIGRLSALLALPAAADPAVAELAQALARSRSEALQFNQLSAPVVAEGGGEAQRLVDAWARWQDGRERLWYRAESLRGHAEAGRTDLMPEAALAVQHEAEQAALAATELRAELQGRAARLLAGGAQSSLWGAVLTWRCCCSRWR